MKALAVQVLSPGSLGHQALGSGLEIVTAPSSAPRAFQRQGLLGLAADTAGSVEDLVRERHPRGCVGDGSSRFRWGSAPLSSLLQ